MAAKCQCRRGACCIRAYDVTRPKMTIWNTPLDEAADDYLAGHSQNDNSVIEEVYRSASKFDEPHMQISKLQALTLQYIVSSNRVNRIVEVGTFVGFSATAMALSLPIGGRITSIEIDQEFHREAQHNLLDLKSKNKIEASVEFICGDAKNVLDDSFADVDLFFLDGDKMNYSFYLNWVTSKMKSGGLFIVDNMLFKGGVVDPRTRNRHAISIRSMTEELKKGGAFDFCFIPVGDCMLLAKKK
jgi:caffeoyl-CoA O-methyltransferase